MLLEQGQESRGFFVLLRGACEVFHRTKTGSEEPYPDMVEGDVFGEVAILQGSPVTACVRAKVPCVVLLLRREWFADVLLAHAPVREALYDLASSRLERTQALITKRLLDRGLV
jgi:cAMP-dependent protein kinase regulator